MATNYYVYIIKCEQWKAGVFQRYTYYTGMTSNPKRRLQDHRSGKLSKWMVKYGVSPKEFSYVECTGYDYWMAIKREKQIKSFSLDKKLKLIEEYNA